MAERRMFHTAVVESDAFLDMPIGAQALYFHLGMQADDDGFVNGPKQVARKLQLPLEELQALVNSGFVLNFDGIVVIKHWRMANSWKSDRLQLPRYPEIAEKLFLIDEKIYVKEKIRGVKNLLQIKKNLIRLYGIQMDSQKKREEKKREEKKKEENKINQKRIEEKNPQAEKERISPLRCASVEMTGEGGVPTPVSFADTPSGEGGMPTPVSSADTPSPEGVRGAVLDGGAVAAHVPASGLDGVPYDESYVLLHRFGKGLVKLTGNQIEGLRRIMEETELDSYVYQLAKQIESGDDPGEHYKTIKNWYLERNGKNV